MGSPVGLLVLWIFHNLLKEPLLTLFSPLYHQRLYPYNQTFYFNPFPRFLLIALSLFLGALTHIGWDSMTHGNGWMVQHLSLFQAELMTLAGVPLIVYFVFKHSSTILGIVLLLYWCWQWYRYNPTIDSELQRRSTWKQSIAFFALFLVLSGVGGIVLAVLSSKVGYSTMSRFVRWGVAAIGMSSLIYTLALIIKSRLTV